MEDTVLYSYLCIFFLILAIKVLQQTRKGHKNLPPSPPALPIIGHLHLLKQLLHRSLHNFSQKYGPILSLKFGSRLAIVVSSPSAVQECFTKNDIVLTNRPLFLSAKHLTYNYTSMIVPKYGDHWWNLRRISATEIFSPNRLNEFLDIRRDEVKILLCRLHCVSSHRFAKVELRSMFMDLTSNIIMRMVTGKRYYGEGMNGNEKARKVRETIEEVLECTRLTNLGDFIPILQWVDFNGYGKRVNKTSERMDLFLQRLIDEHRGNKDRNTMISHLLNLQDLQPEYYINEIIKCLIQCWILY